jgi:ABC-2 type transport system permease protein/lipopolysaccharide transport system permease protein
MVQTLTLPPYLKQLYKYRYVTFSYVQTALKHRYRRSKLGFIWTVAAPLSHYLVIGLMLSVILKGARPDYFTYYFAGAVFFSFVTGVLARAPSIMIGNENFIKKVPVPKMIYVLNHVFFEAINFILTAGTLFIIGLLLQKVHLDLTFISTLFVIVFTAITLIGVGCALSIITVYFRDMNLIIPVVLQALFFVTPITFEVKMLPEHLHWIIALNPLWYYLEAFRRPLLGEGFAPANYYFGILAFSLFWLWLGSWLLMKYDNRIIFKL